MFDNVPMWVWIIYGLIATASMICTFAAASGGGPEDYE